VAVGSGVGDGVLVGVAVAWAVGEGVGVEVGTIEGMTDGEDGGDGVDVSQPPNPINSSAQIHKVRIILFINDRLLLKQALCRMAQCLVVKFNRLS